MVLSDRSIEEELKSGRIIVEPLGDGCIQPSSVDLHLDKKVSLFDTHTLGIIDIKQDHSQIMREEIIGDRPFILQPREFILGSTSERIAIADDLVARIEGKSSLGRLGLIIHSTAGFVDAGWDGNLTLEIANISKLPITLYAGMRICQISFSKMTTSAKNPYGSSKVGSKYYGQRGVTPSRHHKSFNNKNK